MYQTKLNRKLGELWFGLANSILLTEEFITLKLQNTGDVDEWKRANGDLNKDMIIVA